MPIATLTLALALAPLEPLPGSARAEPPPVSAVGVSFAFEPRIGTYPALDGPLRSYGFAPVGTPLQLAWGLRGRMRLRHDLYVAMSMTYGFSRHDHPSTPVPTTTTLVDTAVGAGYWSRRGILAGLDVGFGSSSHSVGSEIEGGALVYLGPSFHPRVGWAFVGRGPMVAVLLGYNVHVPVGDAHQQVLWEEPFGRPAIHAFTFAVESGFGWRIGGRR